MFLGSSKTLGKVLGFSENIEKVGRLIENTGEDVDPSDNLERS